MCSEVCVYAVICVDLRVSGNGASQWKRSGRFCIVGLHGSGWTDRRTDRQLTMTLRRALNPRKREQEKKKGKEKEKKYVASSLPPLN